MGVTIMSRMLMRMITMLLIASMSMGVTVLIPRMHVFVSMLMPVIMRMLMGVFMGMFLVPMLVFVGMAVRMLVAMAVIVFMFSSRHLLFLQLKCFCTA